MNVKMPEIVELSLDDVITRGAPIIAQARTNLAALLKSSEHTGAYWHPTGFIVIPLQDFEGLGLLRLHIWPETTRRKRAGNPETHAHCFHLTSFVLAGEYLEHQFDAHVSDDDPKALMGYSVVPPNGDGKDRIEPDGHRYRLTRKRTETTTAGQFHHLAAGIHHLTDIAPEQTCATLALLSRPQPGRADHLIGPEEHGGQSALRERVDDGTLTKSLLSVGI